MPVIAANDAEAQVSGTPVTTANTGDANSTPFDEVVIGTNMTETFDTANPAHGLQDYKQALASTATAATYVGWTGATLGSPRSVMNGALYLTIHNAIPSSVRWIAFMNGTTLGGYLGLTNTLQGLQWRTAADVAQGTPQPALTGDTLYRIEFNCDFGAGTALARVFVGDSTTQTGTDQTGSALWSITSCDHVRYGMNTANFSSTAGQYLAKDDIMLTTDALPVGPGPYSVGPPTATPYPYKNVRRRMRSRIR